MSILMKIQLTAGNFLIMPSADVHFIDQFLEARFMVRSIYTKNLTVLTVTVTLFALAACTPPMTQKQYGQAEARMLHTVVLGTISDVREVTINMQASGRGETGGALLGSAAGASISPTSTSNTIVGGVLGSLLGGGLENALGTRKGLEILVELDSGQGLVSVSQEADGQAYTPGQRVRILTLNGSARVVHHGLIPQPSTTPPLRQNSAQSNPAK